MIVCCVVQYRALSAYYDLAVTNGYTQSPGTAGYRRELLAVNFSMFSNIICHMNSSYNEKILNLTCFGTKIFDPNIKLYEKFEEESILNSPPGPPIPEAVKSAVPRLYVYRRE